MILYFTYSLANVVFIIDCIILNISFFIRWLFQIFNDKPDIKPGIIKDQLGLFEDRFRVKSSKWVIAY